MDDFVERNIIIGLIVSDDYVREIAEIYKPDYLDAPEAKLLASWCFAYYNKYSHSPKKDIEGIYTAHLKSLDKDTAGDIKEILLELNDEYERDKFNTQYLLDETHKYFQEQNLKQFASEIKGHINSGQVTEAEKVASGYHPIQAGQMNSIDPFASVEKIKAAFTERQKPLIRFGKALGSFWNEEMVRDSFVAIMGIEKIGKTWILLEIAMKAHASGCNVAFFQAGDMTENQFLLRQSVYLSGHSYKEKYCGNIWVPTVDCVKNQIDDCDRQEREEGVSPALTENESKNPTFNSLKEVAQENPDYTPCKNCKHIIPTVWLKKSPDVKVLDYKEAYKAMRKWRKAHKKQFRLSTYANETLCVSEIKSLLDIWEKQEGFVPDVIVIDYADLLTSDPDIRGLDFRNRQNIIWQRLRALSQQKHCLVVTATQAAASAYGKKLMSMSDFSEDKRKYAHVTALYGLNQTDEEKKIGVMRINQIVVREDDFAMSKPVHILQRLQIGRPVLESFFP